MVEGGQSVLATTPLSDGGVGTIQTDAWSISHIGARYDTAARPCHITGQSVCDTEAQSHHLSVERATLILHVLYDDRVMAGHLWQFGVGVSVPFDAAVDHRGITAQVISDVGILTSDPFGGK